MASCTATSPRSRSGTASRSARSTSSTPRAYTAARSSGARALLARLPRPAHGQVHHHLHRPPVPPVRRARDRVRADRRATPRLDVRAQAAGHGIGDRPALIIGVLFTVFAVQLMTL